MAIISSTIIEGSTYNEVAGVIQSASLVVVVTVDVVVGADPATILQSGLDHDGVPKTRAKLNDANPNVRVLSRVPEIVGVSSTLYTIRIVLGYELQQPDSPALYPRQGGASLQQIQTSKYRNGDDITLTSAAAGATPQVGTVNISLPVLNQSFERTMQTGLPTSRASEYIGKVNEDLFLGEAPRTWLCSNVSFEIIDESVRPPVYKFTYDLDHNPDTWDTSIGFKKDDGTFESGTFKDVTWHEATTFTGIQAFTKGIT